MTPVDSLTHWINSSGLFEEEGENKGGVHSYFDQKNSAEFLRFRRPNDPDARRDECTEL